MPEYALHVRHLVRAAICGALLVVLWWGQSARAELGIEGINGEPARNIRLFTPLASEPCDAEEWLIRRRYRNLTRDAARALEPFGYYEATFETSLRFEEECWIAELAVTPGTPVRLRRVDIVIDGDAQDDPAFRPFLRHTRLAVGDVLRHAAYEQFKRNLQISAAERGYVDAEFVEAKIDVWPEEHAADISVRFDSGERYTLGEIEQQQDFLNAELVSGFMDLETGEPFDQSEISRAYTDLSDSGYFGRIQLTPQFEAAENGRIPLNATLEPGTRIEYTVGVGASTDTGPRLRAGFRNNRLNRSGHKLKTDLNLATVLQSLSGEYRIPLADPRSEWMTYAGSLSSEETDTFTNDAAKVGVRRTRRMSPSWARTFGLDFSYESFEVADEKEDTFLVVPSLSFDHKSANRDLYPDRGRRFTVEFLGTSDSLGSTTSFTQVTAWLRWVRALGSKTRLLARGTVGYTETANFDALPPSVRYFAGGDQSIRGFEFESLGPTNADGQVIGGTRLLVGSLEIERQIRGNYYGALFIDGGNAFNERNFEPVYGAGIGLKWRSPVGPVRIYVGFPINEDDRSPRLHLRLGAEL